MSLISVIGFPRIGEKRELKFSMEEFFEGKIGKEDLIAEGEKIRIKQWKFMKANDVAYIPSNDFSLYDTMLDTAVMLGAIPERYKLNGFQDIDTYFALARGYQRSGVDLKAFEMKKWFNTNYHYVVPEIGGECGFKFNPEKILDELDLADFAGITTKPVIIGPFTFLKMSKFKDASKTYVDYIDPVVGNYVELVKLLEGREIDFAQFDEPVLVTDLSETDRTNFKSIYERILAKKGKLKILLQTYFGDIRDVYEDVMKMDFDAVGLDFVEGAGNSGLVSSNGFHEGKILFAGLVNGRNIWRNDYSRSMEILEVLGKAVSRDRIVISTSCSLVHVPYSLKYENLMKGEVREQMSFAEEKVHELKDLASLLGKDDYRNDVIYLENMRVLGSGKKIRGSGVDIGGNMDELDEKDFTRNLAYHERAELQAEVLNLPMFPTTTIGSFPQDKEIRQKRNSYKKGKLTRTEYESFLKGRIRDIVKFQEDIGIDVLVHGEYERNDMVEYFGENLSGFVFTENGWVLSYGMRCVKPPVIFGDVVRDREITPAWIGYAQSLTGKPVKGMLTGPVTIFNWSFPREDIPARDVVYQIALAIREEVLDLEKAGIRIIQIDEAALREKLPLRKQDWHRNYLDWAVKAFRLVCSKADDRTQIHTHMCYSDFADIMDAIKGLDADVITIEAAKSDLSILRSLKENNYDHQIGPGVYDIHSPRIPPVDEMVGHLEKMTGFVDKRSLWINPDCGLKTRGMDETAASLKNMVEASRIMRKKFGSE
jgi:5-methyltetrahydropteroyltriglutamate--homocysteine methyltransferase